MALQDGDCGHPDHPRSSQPRPAPWWRAGCGLAFAIIHCLPGIYSDSTGVHPDNGLPSNGETFPIRLPNRVSLQGTSALNTVFYVDGDSAGPAFEFGSVPDAVGFCSFIDNITICGANESDITADPFKGAAIAIRPQSSSCPTITNCFFVRNYIGVAVVASRDDPKPLIRHHGTRLMNNTFAFNLIGLWNGQFVKQGADPGTPTEGVSELLLVNNIFDAHDPNPMSCPWPASWKQSGSGSWAAQTDFEGVAFDDMVVKTPHPGDYNAYESSRYNTRSGTLIPGLPAASVRGSLADPVPQFDIAAYTGTSSGTGRGVLFVRDLLCAGPFSTQVTGGRPWDYSPMDFRISPGVLVGGGATPTTVNHPLVDTGWGGTFPLEMQNGRCFEAPPGTLRLIVSTKTWTHTSLDHDCEGFGNPRTVDAPAYANVGASPGQTDIGADELDGLIVAGYRSCTTSFLSTSAFNPPIPTMGNEYQWFLGPPGQLASPGAPLPDFRTNNLAIAPFFYGGCAANTSPWFDSWFFGAQSPYYAPSLVDVTPHLAPDPHPWWSPVFAGLPSVGPPITGTGIASAQPVWQWCLTTYNTTLYQDPISGVINPPGSFPVAGPSTYQWLDPSGTPAYCPFPQFVAPSGIPSISAYDPWCRGGPPAALPNNLVNRFSVTYGVNLPSPTALRYSLERLGTMGSPNSNLQSFLVFKEP